MADRPERPSRRDARREDGSRDDEPIFAPVVFEDDDRRLPRGSLPGEDSDAGLLRVLGLVIVLGIVIVALVLPGSPLSVLNRGSDTSTAPGIEARARDEMPLLPDGFRALSRLYDITADEPGQGPWTLTVPLDAPLTDGRNIALYRHDGERWSRIAAALIVEGGASAQGDLEVLPANIAALQRTAVPVTLALGVPAGTAPDLGAGALAEVIAVDGARVADTPTEDGATLTLAPDALTAAAAAAGDAALYLRVSAPAGPSADALNAILATPEGVSTHVAEIVATARTAAAAGVQLDYRFVDASRRVAFTALVVTLEDQLAAAQLGLSVSVPVLPTTSGGAYDWLALSRVTRLWIHGPDDGSLFYTQVEAALAAHRDEGVDLSRLALVVERASRERTRQEIRRMTQRQALVIASHLRTQPESGITPGSEVTLSGVNLDRGAGNSGLHWDDGARAVTFSYADRLGPHTVWIENSFSLGFRLELIDRYALGGIVVAEAQRDEQLPDVWTAVRVYVESGAYDLQQPYGPYLVPCWRASDGAIVGFEAGCWTPGLTESGAATWRAPAGIGVFDVTLVVSDGTTFVGQQLPVRVAEAGAPEARPTPTATPAPTEPPEATATPEPTPTETPAATPVATATP
ncbi:MAG: hypothetical protein O3B31_07050 [Chloroflexi bacterium]|nr:hypothetical protein [Chloroflexota bacterium]MDA1003091.1 hypothetical protein [Chloroflexota bacterium]MQC27723.1 hypothetical protein [Chloroflexota bacterium]